MARLCRAAKYSVRHSVCRSRAGTRGGTRFGLPPVRGSRRPPGPRARNAISAAGAAMSPWPEPRCRLRKALGPWVTGASFAPPVSMCSGSSHRSVRSSATDRTPALCGHSVWRLACVASSPDFVQVTAGPCSSGSIMLARSDRLRQVRAGETVGPRPCRPVRRPHRVAPGSTGSGCRDRPWPGSGRAAA